ncbi:MAG TPA: protein kinase [Thermoanaerobaculaceae bacterium]|nr:protein kinase [Thermoanaerobaculaceae bacterium]HPS78270.1 protein kinase [Thermoanaerobaculaceae bacterium]
MPVSILRPGQRVGHYVLEERIGAGGMGEVWRGRHELLARPVAIKSINPLLAADPKFADRFRQEAKAQATLVHPRIVAVTDFFFVPDGFFLVMPLIAGESLEHHLTHEQLMPLAAASAVSLDILAGLGYAHGKGVIHRDVKPANIMIDGKGHGYLADFGIALMIGQQRLTQTGTTIGTPHYMSPEQILRPRQVDHRSDIYSFGCVLYEMLVGRPPFENPTEGSDTDFLVKEAHLRRPPPSPRSLNPALPPGVEAVVLRALEKRPEDRFPTCEDFATALTNAALEPVGASVTVPLPISRHAADSSGSPVVPVEPPSQPPAGSGPAHVAPIPEPPSAETPPALAAPARGHGPTIAILGLLLAPVLVAVGVLALRLARSPAEVVVGQSGSGISSIATAVGKVRRGGRVVVGPGVYRETVRLAQEVELLAGDARSEVVIEALTGPGLVLSADRATVRGFTVRSRTSKGGEPAPAMQVTAGQPVVEDCSFEGSGDVVVVSGSGTAAMLSRCRLQSTAVGNGLVVDGPARVRAEACEIANAVGGVVARRGGDVLLVGCKVTACSMAGVQVIEKGLATMEDCEVTQSGQAGVVAASGGRLVMRRTGVRNGQAVGVTVRELADALIETCQLTGNGSHGLDVWGAQATARDTTFSDNGGRGVWTRENATATLERCTLTGNLRGPQLADRTSSIVKQ